MTEARPPDHPQRLELNDEVHARPSEPVRAPQRLSYLVLVGDREAREQGWERTAEIAARFDLRGPVKGANHFAADCGDFRLRWERHAEFVRYTFSVAGAAPDADPFAAPAIDAVPADWIARLPGQVLVACHAAYIDSAAAPENLDAIAHDWFAGQVLIGGAVAGGTGLALTDMRIRADGFSRLLLLDRGMTQYQAGRTLQRLLEIETYRMMALLTLPVARALSPFLTECERELARINEALIAAKEDEEAALLDRLTQLAYEIARRQSAGPAAGADARAAGAAIGSDNLYRFSAATAYYELVQRRIGELREQRIEGLQTFGEFTERRLAPAMNTCRAIAARQDSLSQRVARATSLLAARVDITRERQNQDVLASMNRRARIQLRLQETVETLSVAAITYYIVGLVGHAAEGLRALHVPVDPSIAQAVSIPIVAVLVLLAGRRVRRLVMTDR